MRNIVFNVGDSVIVFEEHGDNLHALQLDNLKEEISIRFKRLNKKDFSKEDILPLILSDGISHGDKILVGLPIFNNTVSFFGFDPVEYRKWLNDKGLIKSNPYYSKYFIYNANIPGIAKKNFICFVKDKLSKSNQEFHIIAPVIKYPRTTFSVIIDFLSTCDESLGVYLKSSFIKYDKCFIKDEHKDLLIVKSPEILFSNLKDPSNTIFLNDKVCLRVMQDFTQIPYENKTVISYVKLSSKSYMVFDGTDIKIVSELPKDKDIVLVNADEYITSDKDVLEIKEEFPQYTKLISENNLAHLFKAFKEVAA